MKTKPKEIKFHKTQLMRMVLSDDVARSVDTESREAEFTLSSERAIEDWPGQFILLEHSDNAVVLDRLNSAGPLLFNHDRDQHLGRVLSAEVKDKKLTVRVKFGSSRLASEKFQDVQDGILREVSVSAKIHDIELDKSVKGEGETYRATKWEPLEASLVTVPADITVGINRDSQTNADDFITISRKENIMAKEPTEPVIQFKTDPEDIKRSQKDEQNRVGEIYRLASKHTIDEKTVNEYVGEGKSLESFQRHVLDHVGAKQVSTPSTDELGLSRKEKEEYSIVRALHGQAKQISGGGKFDGLEREVSDAIAKKTNREAKGFFIPMGDIDVKRDLSAVTDNKGGYTVETEVRGESLIELLRNKMKVMSLGARSLTGLQGDIAIPSADGGATAYWLTETGSVTGSDQTFGQLALTPKRLAAMTAYSKQLLAQSSIGIESFVRDDLMQTLALAKDLAALHGTGASNQPTGISATSGINTVTFGAAATFAKMVQFETEVATDNADVSSMAYLTTAAVRGALKTTEKASSTGQFIWDGSEVNGYRAEVSNQVDSNKVIFGDFSQLIVADWAGLDVVVDPYTLAADGQIRIVMTHLTDIGVRHPVSFCVSTDAGNQ